MINMMAALMSLWADVQGENLVRAKLETKTEIISPCRADEFADTLGKSEREIDPSDLPPYTRLIRHGSNVTMAFRPERMNIMIDMDGHIFAITCG